MKFNISEQINKMHLKEGEMTIQSINDYLQKNQKLAEYVSWLVLAYKNDRMDLLKKMIELFKKENLAGAGGESLDNKPLGTAPGFDDEEPVEDVSAEAPEEEVGAEVPEEEEDVQEV